jgi:hypothetical protein
VTYTEFQALIANYLQRSDLTSQIPQFVENARLRMARTLRGRQLVTEASVTITSGDGDVPTGFLEAISLRDSSGIYLRNAGSRNFWAIRQNTGTAYVYRIDSKVRVAPAATGTFTISYFKRPTELTTGSQTVPDNINDIWLYGAVSEGFMYIGDMGSAVPFKQMFDEEIIKANRAYKLEERPVSTYQRYDTRQVAL